MLLEQAVSDIARRLRRNTPHPEAELREGEDVSQEILVAATRHCTDLIVLGHKGKRPVDRFLPGPVSSRVAHHAGCSVLVVGESDADRSREG